MEWSSSSLTKFYPSIVEDLRFLRSSIMATLQIEYSKQIMTTFKHELMYKKNCTYCGRFGKFGYLEFGCGNLDVYYFMGLGIQKKVQSLTLNITHAYGLTIFITLVKSIIMLCGTDNIMRNILHSGWIWRICVPQNTINPIEHYYRFA